MFPPLKLIWTLLPDFDTIHQAPRNSYSVQSRKMETTYSSRYNHRHSGNELVLILADSLCPQVCFNQAESYYHCLNSASL